MTEKLDLDEMTQAILKFAERKDFNLKLYDWQREYLESMFAARQRMVAAELELAKIPRFRWLGPEHMLVFLDDPVKDPADYYRSYDWKANVERLRRYIETVAW